MMLPRYFSYEAFLKSFKTQLGLFAPTTYSFETLGKSVENRLIYGLKIGHGKTRVLIWSQMHGNESTTTRALLEFLKRTDLHKILNKFELYIIPILNPDGLSKWTRNNANDIDLNRDAVALSQPESVFLREAFERFDPHFCFNMHDQRSIYGTLDGLNPVQLSFLSPAANEERAVTPARLKAMAVINKIVKDVQPLANGIIGRYSDVFNVNCVGDYFQSCHVPTILFEAGHAGLDYYREQAVGLMEKSLFAALEGISSLHAANMLETVAFYESIPNIASNYVDVLVKNIASNGVHKNLAIMYHENLENEVLYFVPMLVGVEDDHILNAHQVIDLKDLTVAPSDFNIDDNMVVSCPSLGVLSFH